MTSKTLLIIAIISTFFADVVFSAEIAEKDSIEIAGLTILGVILRLITYSSYYIIIVRIFTALGI